MATRMAAFIAAEVVGAFGGFVLLVQAIGNYGAGALFGWRCRGCGQPY